MVNYKELLNKIEREKKELKEQRTFMPSKLSASKKKYEKYQITERLSELGEKGKKLKKEQKETESSRKKFLKSIDKLARQRITSRRILKQSRPTLTIKEFKAPSILGDENRFFKNTMEETKKSMFFE